MDVEDRDDVRVMEEFEERDFAFEPGTLPGACDVGFVDYFDCDLARGARRASFKSASDRTKEKEKGRLLVSSPNPVFRSD